MGLQDTLSFIVRHPLNRGRVGRALLRFLGWQLRSRLRNRPAPMPFVDETRLLVERGMTGATGNVYCGLHEFEEMSFALHVLRPCDLFVDVGANVGSYTVLTSGAAGCQTIAFEPGPAAFHWLLRNIDLNGLADLTVALNAAAGSQEGSVRLTSSLDTGNRVMDPEEDISDSIEVAVHALDDVVSDTPRILKIDTEGFEGEVLAGARGLLARDEPMALIIEMNGSGERFGFSDRILDESIRNAGFEEAFYDPFNRCLTKRPKPHTTRGNAIYVRGWDFFVARVCASRPYLVLGRLI